MKKSLRCPLCPFWTQCRPAPGETAGAEGGMKASLLSVGLENSASLMSRKSRLGTHHLLAFQKCMVSSSCIPVIFGAGFIGHNVHDCSPRSKGETQILHKQVGFEEQHLNAEVTCKHTGSSEMRHLSGRARVDRRGPGQAAPRPWARLRFPPPGKNTV